MVRDLKDGFFQYDAPGGRTECISVLKLFFVLPFAVIAVMIFSVLVSKFGTKKTFYIIIIFFMGFFAIFGFVLYPNASSLHASLETVERLRASWPGIFYWVIPCLTNWTFTLFYVFAEIWGTMAISSLFWQFANQITKKAEVKRFYAFLPLVGNIGVIFSGLVLDNMSHAKGAEQIRNVMLFMTGVVVFGVAILATYYYLNNVVMKDPQYYDPTDVKAPKKKAKVSITEGIKILLKSPYLLLVSVLVIGYGMSINFAEVIWKDQMKALYPVQAEYQSMMGKLSIAVGCFTILATMVSGYILRKFTWKTAALITPISILVLGLPFFALIVYGKFASPVLLGFSVLSISVVIGLLVDAIGKSIKYCLFDTTKSMSYIPLDPDEKVKGQAAVEVIGGRAGKAGSSAIQVVLLQGGGKLGNFLHVIVPIFVVAITAWIFSVFKLSKKYEEKVAEQHVEKELG